MNKQQINYIQDSFLLYGVCSSIDCPMGLSPFSTRDYTRCPVCDEPAILPYSLAPVINTSVHSRNVFERYLPSYVVDLYRKNLVKGENIGNTSLSQNEKIAKFVGIKNIYLKEEDKNPSGSFKDRGSFMAIALLEAMLRRQGSEDNFIFATVSMGNMAISTAFMSNQINRHSSFTAVSSKTPEKKIDAIQRAAGETGTTLFVVDGDYANIHEIVYRACSDLRQRNVSIFPQLTDDVLRISGYGTLFAEIIDQMKDKEPDFIILPIASGAFFRAGVWSVEALFKNGFIKKTPRIVLVQVRGGDPIIHAMRRKLSKIEKIQIKNNTVAEGLAVSNSRSGNPILKILRKNYHVGISVNAKEILRAKNILHNEGFFAEESSCASVAAVKQLKNRGVISSSDNVVCVLTGADMKKRDLPKLYPNKNNTVYCNLENLKGKILEYYGQAQHLDNSSNGYFC